MGAGAPIAILYSSMKNQKTGMAPALFAGMCLVLFFWAAITLYLESRMGWPVDRAAWSHRAIGWFVNLVLMRTFTKGLRRYYELRGR